MTDNTNIEAEKYLREKYGAYRGHFAWRELEEAFNAGRAALSNAEPVDASTPEAKGNIAAWLRRRAGNDLVMMSGRLAGQIADHIDLLRPSVPAPMTDQRIAEICKKLERDNLHYTLIDLARAMEVAHGIKEQSK